MVLYCRFMIWYDPTNHLISLHNIHWNIKLLNWAPFHRLYLCNFYFLNEMDLLSVWRDSKQRKFLQNFVNAVVIFGQQQFFFLHQIISFNQQTCKKLEKCKTHTAFFSEMTQRLALVLFSARSDISDAVIGKSRWLASLRYSGCDYQ